ncbi:unnamed protein product [Urochloa humidicola]
MVLAPPPYPPDGEIPAPSSAVGLKLRLGEAARDMVRDVHGQALLLRPREAPAQLAAPLPCTFSWPNKGTNSQIVVQFIPNERASKYNLQKLNAQSHKSKM